MTDEELHGPLVNQQGSRASLNTPVLVVDLDALGRNVAAMAAYARSQGLALRPHAKTHKSPQIAKLQIEAGAVGVCCAKIGEAEVMADQGGNISNGATGASNINLRGLGVQRTLVLINGRRLLPGDPTINGNGAADVNAQVQVADQVDAEAAQAAPSPIGAVDSQVSQPAAAPAPVSIAVGQSIDEVTAALGSPLSVIDLGTKKVYKYKDMKITFRAGKVSSVE